MRPYIINVKQRRQKHRKNVQWNKKDFEGKQVQVAYEQSTQEYDFCKPM
jgi:hypothetical protein